MKNWIAVASAEHVAIGRAQGFMQVCHGKAAPLRRLRAGVKSLQKAPMLSATATVVFLMRSTVLFSA